MIDSSGKQTSTSTSITVGQHRPDGDGDGPARRRPFAFGDKIPYKVTVTDPEDGTSTATTSRSRSCSATTRTATPRRSRPAAPGFLQTIADDVSHGGNVFGVISATYTDKGGRAPTGAPPLTTVGQTNIRQKHQEVELAVNQSGTNTAANTDGGAGTHRGSLAAGRLDPAQRAVQPDEHRTRSPFRVADAAAGRTAGSPLAAIEIRQDSITGPILATHNLVSTGGDGRVEQPDVPDRAWPGTHELFLVFRAVTNGADGRTTCSTSTGPSSTAKGSRSVKAPPATGTVGGSVPATLSLTLGAPATFGAFTPGVAKEYTASTTANVISSAGDAALSVAPSPAFLTNGAFSLAEPLQVSLSKSAWTAPTSNERVDIGFKQLIKANDPLRTGSYSKTLTFTLSTTTP